MNKANDEIIKALEKYAEQTLNYTASETLKQAAEALKREPCTDAVSRSHALSEFKRIYFDNPTVIRCAELVLNGEPPVTSERVDFDELKRKILAEVDGGTDDKWLRYGDVCDRISDSIDEYANECRGREDKAEQER